jgi:hypothetical protein
LAALPEVLVLREVRGHLGMPGFRTRQMTLVTTRLEAQVYRVADLAERYHQRWPVEPSLAHLKTTMPMEVLHCQTGAGVDFAEYLSTIGRVRGGRPVVWTFRHS